MTTRDQVREPMSNAKAGDYQRLRAHLAELRLTAAAEALTMSAYDLMCRGAYELTSRGRRGDHGMESPPVTRASRSLSRQEGPLMASTSQ